MCNSIPTSSQPADYVSPICDARSWLNFFSQVDPTTARSHLEYVVLREEEIDHFASLCFSLDMPVTSGMPGFRTRDIPFPAHDHAVIGPKVGTHRP